MGIDVVAVHPSPVASNFFDKAHKLDALEMAKKSAVSPNSVRFILRSEYVSSFHYFFFNLGSWKDAYVCWQIPYV
jgi:hypothetical protein